MLTHLFNVTLVEKSCEEALCHPAESVPRLRVRLRPHHPVPRGQVAKVERHRRQELRLQSPHRIILALILAILSKCRTRVAGEEEESNNNQHYLTLNRK